MPCLIIVHDRYLLLLPEARESVATPQKSRSENRNARDHVAGCGAHPASYPVGTGESFSGVKLLGREADHSPPSAEVKKGGAMHALPHTSS
jgi:hypothetical protein